MEWYALMSLTRCGQRTVLPFTRLWSSKLSPLPRQASPPCSRPAPLSWQQRTLLLAGTLHSSPSPFIHAFIHQCIHTSVCSLMCSFRAVASWQLRSMQRLLFHSWPSRSKEGKSAPSWSPPAPWAAQRFCCTWCRDGDVAYKPVVLVSARPCLAVSGTDSHAAALLVE